MPSVNQSFSRGMVHRSDQETTESHNKTLKPTCFEHNSYRCVITGNYNYDSIHAKLNKEPVPDNAVISTCNSAHINPHAMGVGGLDIRTTR